MVDRTDPAHVTVTDTAKVFFDILPALRRRRLPTEGARWPHVPNIICLPLYMILSTVNKQDTFFTNLQS